MENKTWDDIICQLSLRSVYLDFAVIWLSTFPFYPNLYELGLQALATNTSWLSIFGVYTTPPSDHILHHSPNQLL